MATSTTVLSIYFELVLLDDFLFSFPCRLQVVRPLLFFFLIFIPSNCGLGGISRLPIALNTFSMATGKTRKQRRSFGNQLCDAFLPICVCCPVWCALSPSVDPRPRFVHQTRAVFSAVFLLVFPHLLVALLVGHGRFGAVLAATRIQRRAQSSSLQPTGRCVVQRHPRCPRASRQVVLFSLEKEVRHTVCALAIIYLQVRLNK